MEKEFDVFLSHNSQDKQWVIRLKDALEAHDIKVWLDKDEIRPGDLFAKALETGISESRAVAMIISPAAMDSGWVEAEYYRAVSLATNSKLQLIPVLYEDAEIPGFLKDRSWVDFRDENDYGEKVERLVWGITGRKPENKGGNKISSGEDKTLLTELDTYLQSVQENLGMLERFFESGYPFYRDQCKLAIERLGVLDNNIKLPPSYSLSTTIIGLETQIEKMKNLLIDFSRTCPPGDRDVRRMVEEQIDVINTVLFRLSGK